MVSYIAQGLFKTKWFWFENPHEEHGFSEVVFFSYAPVDVPGFKQRKGSTTIVHLTESYESLWGAMRKKFIREQIEKGVAAGVRVREGTYEEFLPIYHSFRTAKSIPTSELAALKPVARFFVADIRGRLVAGGMFVVDATHARAFALASLRFDTSQPGERERIGFANRCLIWEVMKAFKAEGIAFLDLGGLEEGRTDKERAFNEFKEAFGGVRTESFYYRKTYSPLLRFLRYIRSHL